MKAHDRLEDNGKGAPLLENRVRMLVGALEALLTSAPGTGAGVAARNYAKQVLSETVTTLESDTTNNQLLQDLDEVTRAYTMRGKFRPGPAADRIRKMYGLDEGGT